LPTERIGEFGGKRIAGWHLVEGALDRGLACAQVAGFLLDGGEADGVIEDAFPVGGLAQREDFGAALQTRFAAARITGAGMRRAQVAQHDQSRPITRSGR
jgi:hypothetical protein